MPGARPPVWTGAGRPRLSQSLGVTVTCPRTSPFTRPRAEAPLGGTFCVLAGGTRCPSCSEQIAGAQIWGAWGGGPGRGAPWFPDCLHSADTGVSVPEHPTSCPPAPLGGSARWGGRWVTSRRPFRRVVSVGDGSGSLGRGRGRGVQGPATPQPCWGFSSASSCPSTTRVFHVIPSPGYQAW